MLDLGQLMCSICEADLPKRDRHRARDGRNDMTIVVDAGQ